MKNLKSKIKNTEIISNQTEISKIILNENKQNKAVRKIQDETEIYRIRLNQFEENIARSSQIKIGNELEVNQNKTTQNIETEISTNNQISKPAQSAKTAQVQQKNFHEEIQDFSELDITNHFMFFKIFTTYSAACKRLLEILLGTKIAKIDYPLGEKDFEADIDSHAIRVDVYTEDENFESIFLDGDTDVAVNHRRL